jgi:hypothetical protein
MEHLFQGIFLKAADHFEKMGGKSKAAKIAHSLCIKGAYA